MATAGGNQPVRQAHDARADLAVGAADGRSTSQRALKIDRQVLHAAVAARLRDQITEGNWLPARA